VNHPAKLTQEPAENCCPATVTTFLGLKLECELDPADHATALHLDVDQGIWWLHADEMDDLAEAAGRVRYRALPVARNPVAAAVAAEQQRIRELAIEYAAKCRRPGAHYATPFADLIRDPT
jgi:hypothetical protein